MKRTCLAGIALLLVALAATLVRSDPPAADKVPQIAVVRPAQITHKCAEWKQMTDAIKAQYAQIKQEEAKRENEVQQLIEQMSQLKAGSAQWAQLRDTIDDKRLAAEVWAKKTDLDLQRRQKAGMKSVYDHVTQAVQTIAQSRHLDLVLADNSPDFSGPDLDAVPLQNFQQMLSARAVVFANKNADITEDVLTLMDANFKSQAASTGPQNPPAH
jgi:Skp family chaperone for outer membrane proteins